MRKLIPNSTQVPDVIIDVWMALLSGAEFKVILYIARRTYGFGKEGDTISLKQLVQGIVTREGRRLDSGTGLNKDTVSKALTTLEEKGLVIRTRRDSDEFGHLSNHYRLNLDADGFGEGNPSEPIDGDPDPLSENPTSSPESSVRPPVGKSDKLSPKSRQAHVGLPEDSLSENPYYKKQDQQETEKQETATTAVAVALSPSAISEREESRRLLVEVGFSQKDSHQLADRHPLDAIRNQIGWLERRTVTKNKLGMLRTAIQQNWPKPATPEQEQRDALKDQKRKAEEARIQEGQLWGVKLKTIYDRLPAEAPAAHKSLTEFIEQERARMAEKRIVRDHPSALKHLQAAYDREPKKIEMMIEFFKDKDDLPEEYSSLIRQVPPERMEDILKQIEAMSPSQQS